MYKPPSVLAGEEMTPRRKRPESKQTGFGRSKKKKGSNRKKRIDFQKNSAEPIIRNK